MHHDYIIVTGFSLTELQEKVNLREEAGYVHLGGVSEVQCRITGRATFLQAMISQAPT